MIWITHFLDGDSSQFVINHLLFLFVDFILMLKYFIILINILNLV